jgi:hypothetical protein
MGVAEGIGFFKREVAKEGKGTRRGGASVRIKAQLRGSLRLCA